MVFEPTFRPATLADPADLAVLADIAANGLANRIWLEQAGPGQSALEVGRQSVRRPEEVDSYRNATMAMVGPEIAGCLIGGLPEDLYDAYRLDEKRTIFAPSRGWRFERQAHGTSTSSPATPSSGDMDWGRSFWRLRPQRPGRPAHAAIVSSSAVGTRAPNASTVTHLRRRLGKTSR